MAPVCSGGAVPGKTLPEWRPPREEMALEVVCALPPPQFLTKLSS